MRLYWALFPLSPHRSQPPPLAHRSPPQCPPIPDAWPPPLREGNRLDSVRACGIVSWAINRGFPAGEPGGRDAGFSLAMADTALWGQPLPERRCRSGPNTRQAKSEMSGVRPS